MSARAMQTSPQYADPVVSVLMSMRNGRRYVGQTVASMIAQTFPGWEMIVVDNASDDGSADYVENLARNEPRIRVLRNRTDLGHSGGLNRGLAECRGTWIARIDADDVALPDRLQRQLAFVQGHPEVKVASCLAYYIDANGKRVGKTYHDLTTRETFERYMARNEPIGILHPGAFIEKATLAAVGGYREEFGPANDIDLWCRIGERGAMILVQPEYLMEYRVHGGSISARSFVLARLKCQWARDCMRARRSGQPEPTWDAFLAARNNAPWWLRLNRWRKTHAKRLYRQSGQNFSCQRRLRAFVEIALATLLEPNYTLPRLQVQRLK
jgi:glycosyltransferase involved in cell wall biosynthesis